jgi:hypothetical protein
MRRIGCVERSPFRPPAAAILPPTPGEPHPRAPPPAIRGTGLPDGGGTSGVAVLMSTYEPSPCSNHLPPQEGGARDRQDQSERSIPATHRDWKTESDDGSHEGQLTSQGASKNLAFTLRDERARVRRRHVDHRHNSIRCSSAPVRTGFLLGRSISRRQVATLRTLS